VAVEAGESGQAFHRLARGKLPLPLALQLHLARIGRVGKAAEKRAVMRCADGNDMVHTIVALVSIQPCAHGQSAHAVRDQHRRLAGGCGDALHGIVDDIRVVVDRAEHRLEVDRHKRDTELA